jgi:hypothetical protein
MFVSTLATPIARGSEECTDASKPFYCPRVNGENCHPQSSSNSTCCQGSGNPENLICTGDTSFCGSFPAHPNWYPKCFPCPGLEREALDANGQCVDLTQSNSCGAIGNQCPSHQKCSQFCAIYQTCRYICKDIDPCWNAPCANQSSSNCVAQSYPLCEKDCFYCQPWPLPPIVTCPSGGPTYPHLPADMWYYDQCFAPLTSISGPMPIRTQWKMLQDPSGLYMLVALSENGNTACMSTNSVDCMYVNETCARKMEQQNNVGSSQPIYFECGDQHYRFWNTSGYHDAAHWCTRGYALFRPEVTLPKFAC